MSRWCSDVVKEIRFHYDRKAVAEELYVHLADSRDYMMEEGLSEAEAERAAIAAMGDPVALGKELNQVHSPLLGLLSRWLVRMLIGLLCGILIAGQLFEWINPLELYNWAVVQTDPFATDCDEEFLQEELHMGAEILAEVAPGEVTTGPYTISVQKGWLQRSQLNTGGYLFQLVCLLRIEAPVWRKFPDGLYSVYLETDGQERIFPSGTTDDETFYYFWNYSGTDRLDVTWCLDVWAYPKVGDDWSPQWVELKLPEEIGDFTFRLNLDYLEVTP